jgi:SAM-dependent methyltransferase
MTYGELQAARYENDNEHALPPEEANIWVAEVRRRTGAGGRLLDIGAGTGLLTSLMKDIGMSVTGLEPSEAMIEVGLKNSPNLVRGDFVLGHAHDGHLFGPGTFDWIVSRQTLCHLHDPGSAFGIWHNWLQPCGYMLLVDGFWPRSSWRGSELIKLPFAALTDTDPVAVLMAEAGMEVLQAGPFPALDKARAVRCAGSRPRYVVLGRKT